jgi:hypothetical protein
MCIVFDKNAAPSDDIEQSVMEFLERLFFKTVLKVPTTSSALFSTAMLLNSAI